jgi:hypothetical protein
MVLIPTISLNFWETINRAQGLKDAKKNNLKRTALKMTDVTSTEK